MQQLDAQEDARGRINSRRWAQQEEKEERVSEQIKQEETRGDVAACAGIRIVWLLA
jgi:hypothetical protein